MSDGEIEFTLAGQTETLRPTLGAAKSINSAFGNFQEAFRRLASFDLSAYVAITAAGLSKKQSDVETAVFKTGMTELTEPLSRFVGILANGGREPSDDDKKDDNPKGEG